MQLQHQRETYFEVNWEDKAKQVHKERFESTDEPRAHLRAMSLALDKGEPEGTRDSDILAYQAKVRVYEITLMEEEIAVHTPQTISNTLIPTRVTPAIFEDLAPKDPPSMPTAMPPGGTLDDEIPF